MANKKLITNLKTVAEKKAGQDKLKARMPTALSKVQAERDMLEKALRRIAFELEDEIDHEDEWQEAAWQVATDAIMSLESYKSKRRKELEEEVRFELDNLEKALEEDE